MYSSRTIQRSFEMAELVLRRRFGLPKHWKLEPSTQAEIEEMNAHFAGLLDSRGNRLRELTREEELWVLAESTMCKLDFKYFAARYCRIQDWQSRLVGFEPNLAQRLVLSVFVEQEEAGLAQMYQFLKARQLGITTLWQVLGSHRVFFYRNVNFVTGSSDPDKSRKMVQKLELIWDQLPWWLRPRRTAYRAGELSEYGDLNSSISVQWGNQKTGIGRGGTATMGHLSELASFTDPELLVDAALVRTLHENPFTLFGLESTAEGMDDWWHRTWNLNVRMDGHGLARFKPIFLPWFLGRDLYPTDGWLRRRPIPAGWQAPEYVEAHAAAAKGYVAGSALLRKALGPDWSLSLEQKWFYYLEYEEAREKRQTPIFLQEMPANPDEAFQSANPTVFSFETLNEVRTRVIAAAPLGVFELRGPLVSPTYYVSRPTSSQSIALNCSRPNGKIEAKFELVPVQQVGWPDADPDGRIYVWEWPQRGETYGISVDPSEGVDQDSSVVQVIKKATPAHPDVQVAEWASNKVAPTDLWVWIFALAHLYTSQGARGWNYPRVVVEVNISAGDAAQTEMLKRGWSNFHQRFDPTKTGSTVTRARALTEEIGWKTTAGSRPKLISWARSHIRDGKILINSPWLARELAKLEYNLDRKKIEASKGNHDDRFMALGMMLASWYDPSLYGSTPPAWAGERAMEQELATLPVYMGDVMIGQAAGRLKPGVVRVDARVDYSKLELED